MGTVGHCVVDATEFRIELASRLVRQRLVMSLMLREMLNGLCTSRRGELDTRFHQHLVDIMDMHAHTLADHQAIIAVSVGCNAEAACTAMARLLKFVADARLDA